jgi:opacity protein-like surface antigen
MNCKIILFHIFIISISVTAQNNMQQALKKGGWTGGLAGWVGWENFKTSDNNSNSKVDGYNFIFSSRNGSLVENYGVFGFDFQWQQKDRTTSPDPNTNNQSEYLNEKIWFLGLWGRYYFPMEGELAMFIEGSAGYAVFDQEQSKLGYGEADYYTGKSANGFAYNAGAGFSLFVSPNAAFEITGRYEGGSLNGDQDLNIKLSNIYILFGIQIYLR